jgi:hypothetical protein
VQSLIKFIKNNYILIGIIFISFFLRTININKPDGLWFDEAVSFFSSQKSFPFGIIKFCVTSDLQPPIYSIFLNLWSKLFGTDDTVLRMMSVFAGVAIIPVIYFTASILATKRAGLLAAMFVCVNSLLIFYSQEVRVYSLAALFSAISIMFLAKILKDSVDIKNYVGYIISNIFLVYTSSFGLAFVGFQSIIYLIYLLIDKKPVKKYLISQTITFLISLPFFLTILYYASTMAKGIVYIFDWAKFRPEVILYIIQDWFSPILINIFNYPIGYFNVFIHSIKSLFIILLIVFPVTLYITGLIKSLKVKENIILASIFISFFLFQILMTVLGKIPLVSRYTIILLPVMIVLVAIGLSDHNKEKFSRLTKNIVLTYFIINLCFISVFARSAPRFPRPETLRTPYEVMSKYNFTAKDLVVMPYGGIASGKYNDKNIKILDFDILEAYNKRNEKYLLKIFDKSFLKTLNQNNSNELLKNYLFSEQPPKIFESYFKNQVFAHLEKDSRVGFAISRGINPFTENDLKFLSYDNKVYNQQSLLMMLSSKMTVDMLKIANKYLKPVGYNKNGVWEIYIFEKK